jgi:hypothetical protein
MKKSYFQEVQPERDVSGNQFTAGEINYNWTMSSTGYFNPYESYLKLRFKLYKRTAGADVSLTVADQIAPNMFMVDNLFQQVKMNINDECVSEIPDYVAQVSALKQRMFQPEERMNNYLADTEFSQAYLKERQAQVCSVDGFAETGAITQLNSVQVLRDKRTFEAIWRPKLGFFDIDEFIPCCDGLFNLKLTPQTASVLKRVAIETTLVKEAGDPTDANNDYVFEIESMALYLLKGIGAPVKSKNIKLRTREIRCQSQNLTTNSLHQKTFQVHPNTQELTLSYQFSGASISDNRFSASKFRCNGSDELKLRRFWINYGGKQLPTPIPDVQYDTTLKIDYLTQRYVESLSYARALKSPEPLRKWLERGVYFHFSGYSEDEKEDRCHVSSQFDIFDDSSIRPNILLFDHYVRTTSIHIENGRVRQVESL